MKNLFTFLVIIFVFGTFTACSSDDDSPIKQEVNDFTNAEYIKKIMIGKWQFKSHFSGSYWINTPGNSYFVFNADNTYTYKSILESDPLEDGTYVITPTTSEYNAILTMTNKKGYKSKLILLGIDGNIVELWNGDFKERYQKQ